MSRHLFTTLATCQYAKQAGSGTGHDIDMEGPKGRKTCCYCRGRMIPRRVVYGVFVHSSANGGDARYLREQAIHVLVNKLDANAVAIARGDHNHCVRELPYVEVAGG